MKKDRCDKCGKFTYLFRHHILPQSTFGKGEENEGDTADLCGNCHTDYHQYLGKESLKNTDVKFHYNKYYKWFYLGIFILVAVGGVCAVL